MARWLDADTGEEVTSPPVHGVKLEASTEEPEEKPEPKVKPRRATRKG